MRAAGPRLTAAACRLSGVIVVLALSSAAQGQAALDLPQAAVRTASAVQANGTLPVATGPWKDEGLPHVAAEGQVATAAWRLTDAGLSTLDLIRPLREQLVVQGYDILFECETQSCGGFDFRYEIEVLPEPEMHVDLGDFRYLSARRGGADAPDYATILVSRSSAHGFIQIATLGPATPAPARMSTSGAAPQAPAAPVAADRASDEGGQAGGDAWAERLETSGTVSLDDLVFETGSSELEEGRFASLAAIAAFLATNPGTRLTLVGHTDAEGPLGANVTLSKRRAQSVADRLAEDYGVDPARLSAEGVGFLAPRASNLTPEGRMQNRRVEAMLTPGP